MKFRELIPQSIRSMVRRVFPKRYQALDQMDRKLLRYIPPKNGFFVELGANNGISQSNTYHLERCRGWTGILVEPLPELFAECKKNRPKSRVFNYACVGQDYEGSSVEIVRDNLKSAIRGVRADHPDDRSVVAVPAITLSKLLTMCDSPHVDLMTLDVEGYEIEVLRGLDLDMHCPDFLLVELNDREAVESYLSNWYNKIADFTWRDSLFRRKS